MLSSSGSNFALVVITKERHLAGFHHPIEARIRIRPVSDNVTKAENLANSLGLDIFEHRFQGFEITMDITDQGAATGSKPPRENSFTAWNEASSNLICATEMPNTDQNRTKTAYGLQWNRFRIIRTEEDEATFLNRTRLAAADLDGKLVLDAGCGMGRYLRIAARGPHRRVVGMDLSQAVRAARELTAGLPGVSLVRADLLRLPFPAESFDVVYSLGVLDHTPDPKSAFLGLARLLKPGGRARRLGL